MVYSSGHEAIEVYYSDLRSCSMGGSCRNNGDYQGEIGFVAAFGNNPEGGSIDLCSTCLLYLAGKVSSMNMALVDE